MRNVISFGAFSENYTVQQYSLTAGRRIKRYVNNTLKIKKVLTKISNYAIINNNEI